MRARTARIVLGLGLIAASVPGALLGAGGSTAAAATSQAPVAPGGVALTWTPAYMSSNQSYTKRQAVALARRFNLVAGMPVSFKRYAGAMRAANPRLTLLAYANATLASPEQVKGVPEREFAHDRNGRRIKATGFGAYLMEPANAGWRSRATHQCASRAVGFDGCLVDMLTLGIFSKNFVSALPVVPGTHSVYTQPQYQKRLIAFGKQYQTANPNLEHVFNAVENSYRYWQAATPSRPEVLGLPSAQMEDFLRGARNPVKAFPTRADWLRNVRVITDLESHHVTGLFSTKLWVSATNAQVARWERYAMSTFLMGANGHSYFAFTRSRDKAGVRGTTLPYRMPRSIGAPLAAMHAVGAAYERAFAHGLAVTNPTRSTVTVPLGAAYTRLDGRTVTSLRLGPHDGQVLTR